MIAIRLLLALVFSFSTMVMTAQITAKDQAKGKGGDEGGALTGQETFKKTTRNEDIKAFTQAISMMEGALEGKAVQESKMIRDNLVKLTRMEIARSNYDLSEIKKGNIKNLEQWYTVNKPGEKINLNLEINALTNRINHDAYLSNRIAGWDLNDLSNERMNDGFIANLKSFQRNMEKNLKYSANDRLVKKKPPSGGTAGQEPIEGPGYTTKGGNQEVINTDDPRLKNYFMSKELRKNDFGTGLASLTEDISKKDDMAARKEFKKLHKIMMDEVNANNWMLNLISSGTIKGSGIDNYELQKTLNTQRSLLNKASKIRPKLGSDPAALSDALEIIKQFGSTL